MQTPKDLRKKILCATHEALISVYGLNYADLCLQSSLIVKRLLEIQGIRSKLIFGAVCTLGIPENGNVNDFVWFGFWGEGHHFFVCTEYYEIVDLTVSQMHLHKSKSSKKYLQLPAFFIDGAKLSTDLILYLPEISTLSGLEGDELVKLQLAITKAEEFARTNEISSTIVRNAVFDLDDLERMRDEGHPWVLHSTAFRKLEIPLPSWVINRIEQLKNHGTEKNAANRKHRQLLLDRAKEFDKKRCG